MDYLEMLPRSLVYETLIDYRTSPKVFLCVVMTGTSTVLFLHGHGVGETALYTFLAYEFLIRAVFVLWVFLYAFTV